MNQTSPRGYRFATEAQWNACLFAGVDVGPRRTWTGVRPFAPYAGPGKHFQSHGGRAPASSPAGDVVWIDDQGRLLRLAYGDSSPVAINAPAEIARAIRLVATPDILWAASGSTLHAFDFATLTRRFNSDLVHPIRDIAGEGCGGVFALLEDGCGWKIAAVDCAGETQLARAIECVPKLVSLEYLKITGRLVLLAADSSKLFWLGREQNRPDFSIALATLRTCFKVAAFASDGRNRLFVAGTVSGGQASGDRHSVLVLDDDGNLLGDVPLAEKPTGVAVTRDYLFVTTEKGLLRLDASDRVPLEASEIHASFVTPALQSPSVETLRRWLRAEAKVDLPPGSALELSCASTGDSEIYAAAQKIHGDRSLAAGLRMHQLIERLGPWRSFAFSGGATKGEETGEFSVPLFNVTDRYVWIRGELTSSPGGGLPVLSELAVLYPGHTLMENLPAIYQRAEAQPGSFLRSLVGVLETTTQSLDARIARMGSHIHPQTADGAWLDYIARWIGLPWDDALSQVQKRAILNNAAAIARGRGTRAGLEALLASLMPKGPRRFRIVDVTRDYGLIKLGGECCAGSRLPAVLGGLPCSATELGSKAILGKACLPGAESGGDCNWLSGRLRVDIFANAQEHKAWEPWLRRFIDEMVPVTARVQLRWLNAGAFGQDQQLDEGLALDPPPVTHLGTGAITGLARLPDRPGLSLDDSSIDPGTTLH